MNELTEKLRNCDSWYGCHSSAANICGNAQITAMCKDAADAIGAPCKQLLDIFDQFCKDCGYPLISRNHTGIVLCKMYGLKRKSARVNGKVTWIYIEA